MRWRERRQAHWPRARRTSVQPAWSTEELRGFQAGRLAEVERRRGEVDVRKRRVEQDRAQGLGEERRRDEESREELEDEVLGAQDPEDRLGADREQADEEVQPRDEKERERRRKQEEDAGGERGRGPQREEDREHDRDRHREEDRAERRLARRVGDHRHLEVDRPDQVHREPCLPDLGPEVPVDLVEVEGPDGPADGDVRDHLGQRQPHDAVGVLEDRPPDEVVDRDVEEIRQDAHVVARPVGEHVQEPDPGEGDRRAPGRRGRASRDALPGRCA